MTDHPDGEGAFATLRLDRSRALLRNREGRLLAVTAGVLYLFVALLVGQMLVFGPTGAKGTEVYYLTQGIPWWNFPLLVVILPNAIVTLPFFSLAAMLVVAVGIGIGMAVSVRLALLLWRWSRRRAAGPTVAGSLTGLTPALLALLTLGACCSTTAATTASLGAVALATGRTPDELLANAWFLSIFQVGVLWVALVAQERLVTVYELLIARSDPEPALALPSATPGRTGSWLVRAAVLIAAVLWALSGVADAAFGSLAEGNAGAIWSILGFVLPAGAAAGVAFWPTSIARRLGPAPLGLALRAAFVVLAGTALLAAALFPTGSFALVRTLLLAGTLAAALGVTALRPSVWSPESSEASPPTTAPWPLGAPGIESRTEDA